MSDATPDPLDMRATLAQIDRDRAEALKFAAEQRKLSAEAAKLDRDRWLAPAVAVAALLGGVATILITVARALRWLP